MIITPFYHDTSSTGRSLLYANFNQDYSCFALGLDNGFRIYACEPLKEISRREFYSYEASSQSPGVGTAPVAVKNRDDSLPLIHTEEESIIASRADQSNDSDIFGYTYGLSDADVSIGSLNVEPIDENATADEPSNTSFAVERASGTGVHGSNLAPLKVGSPPKEPQDSGPPEFERQRELGLGAGVGICEMLYRCNYIALVGGGPNPCYPPNKVVIWDENLKAPVLELEFETLIRSVRLLRHAIVVVLMNKVVVYSFSKNPKKLMTLDTVDNPKGLIAVSSEQPPPQSGESHSRTPSSTLGGPPVLLAAPGKRKGHVQIVDLRSYIDKAQRDAQRASSGQIDLHESNSIDLANTLKVRASVIVAHSTSICCLTLSKNGSLLATASTKGTLIRIHDTATGQLLKELRRGIDRAEIYCINFDSTDTRLVVTSDKRSIHVFDLEVGTTGLGESTTMARTGSHHGASTGREPHSGDLHSPPSSPSSCSTSSPSVNTYDSTVHQQSSPSLSSSNRSRLSFFSSFVPKYFSETTSQRSSATFRVDGSTLRDGISSSTAHLTRYLNITDGDLNSPTVKGRRLFGRPQRVVSSTSISSMGALSSSRDRARRNTGGLEPTVPGKSIAALLPAQTNVVIVIVDDGVCSHWKFSEKRKVLGPQNQSQRPSASASPIASPYSTSTTHGSATMNPTPMDPMWQSNFPGERPRKLRLADRLRQSEMYPEPEDDGFTHLRLDNA